MFRQSMMAATVRLEVLPIANRPRYEKSLIGQLFTADGKESPSKGRSPMVARAQADSQPEPSLNSKAEVRRPDTLAKTPEPVLQNTPPQSGPGSLERSSPTPAARPASSSPTSRTRSQSPLATKNPGLPALSNIANRKGGKKIKIDLKKGKSSSYFPFNISNFENTPEELFRIIQHKEHYLFLYVYHRIIMRCIIKYYFIIKVGNSKNKK